MPPSAPSTFIVRPAGPLPAGLHGALTFTYRPNAAVPSGARIWLCYDIRQNAGLAQTEDPAKPDFFGAVAASGAPLSCTAYRARTLDLYPAVPEFLHVCELHLPAGLPESDALTFTLGTDRAPWTYPEHPIDPFRFWLVEGRIPDRSFDPVNFRGYRTFNPPLDPDDRPRIAALEFTGPLPTLVPENTRSTPGILWGDIHGMAFNQRPLDDFYAYARNVARFDFAAAMLFSYNTCLGDVWAEVKAAADRFTRPGEFVAVAGIEFGTLPDGSHRNVHFFDPGNVPPIFFEDRPPARDPRIRARYHPDTVFCRDLDDFYATVARYGGIVTGHFHTLTYRREILAELWQKQVGSAAEETRVFGLLNQGMRLGLVAGSDTHDSMPGNPDPEPGCPQPAGFMAVLADECTPAAIHRAILDRRVYGTTGARIALHLDAAGRPMGSILPRSEPRTFRVRVEGSSPIARVDLVRNGAPVSGLAPTSSGWSGELHAPAPESDSVEWYVVRVTQRDGHRAWSSPVWFE